jgi:hypothetical protein
MTRPDFDGGRDFALDAVPSLALPLTPTTASPVVQD